VGREPEGVLHLAVGGAFASPLPDESAVGRELLDVAVPIAHIDVTRGVDRHASGILKLAAPVPSLPHLVMNTISDVNFWMRKIVGVGDVDIARRTKGYLFGGVELAVARALRPPLAQESRRRR